MHGSVSRTSLFLYSDIQYVYIQVYDFDKKKAVLPICLFSTLRYPNRMGSGKIGVDLERSSPNRVLDGSRRSPCRGC